jgi:hypothetical protein
MNGLACYTANITVPCKICFLTYMTAGAVMCSMPKLGLRGMVHQMLYQDEYLPLISVWGD